MELFESQVKQNPNKTAILDNTTEYTYKELNEKVNQLANCLKKKSITNGDFVAILLEPSSDFIIFIFAIIKLGAVYVPLDILAPKTRLNEILIDANPKLIITNKDYQSQLTETHAPISLVKQIHLESISYPKENLNMPIQPDAPLYMIYTSGSTGTPKGVIIPHCAVVNMAKVENYANVQENETVAQFNNLAFDASTFEIWSPLLNGGRLSIIPNNTRKNYVELKNQLIDTSVNYLLLPTGYFHQLIKTAPDTLDSVNTILFGGEQINPNLLSEFIIYRNQNKLPVTLINGYGPSEATTFACKHIVNQSLINDHEHLSSIGKEFSNTKTYVFDENLNIVDEGELYISGIHLAAGYHNSPSQNQEKFINNPFCNQPPFERMYKTGDLVRKLGSGDLVFTGRVDDQVKVGGFRIYLSEIERRLMEHEAISLAAVLVELGGESHQLLTAYIVFSSKNTMLRADNIRAFLSELLPPYMLPAKYVRVEEFPLTAIGKIDKKQLDKISHTDLSFHVDTSSESYIEETIKKIWKHLLNRKSIETHKNLFELGANSLLLTEACSRINKTLQTELQIADMLTHPTIHHLSRYIEGDIDTVAVREKKSFLSSEIAIIGMSCRFPKANNLDEFWSNLCQGEDCLTRFNNEQITPSRYLNINFVPVKGTLSNIDQFDASFFGFSPVDANITDPQQRIFLECAWEALEHAAIAPSKLRSKIISVFAGMTDSTYLHENLLKNNQFCKEYDLFQQRIATSTSMLSTQTSYRLNLKGSSINVNTACSTGLIAVDQACRDLMLGQSDIALAGASSISVPQVNGYIYQQGSIVSPDGYCRPFDEKANGTVFSNGVGVVILKRLDDAIKDNDTIYAIIKSSGVNNDGSSKLGFTAPSINGQISCIRDALAGANLTAEQISYIEAHGTATALGDVIELNALSSVFREQTDKTGFCALGSVKANIGHTDVTAGIAGLIKTALCLYHKKIPPVVHYKTPNPDLGLNKGPFFVNTQLINWDAPSSKRYAGISSFGVGGTNIHMILSDFNSRQKSHSNIELKEQLILLSAKTETALEQRTCALSNYITSDNFSNDTLANLAYTLQTGREDFQWRRFCIGKNTVELQNNLFSKSPVYFNEETHHNIAFLFSGQGAQYHRMAMGLFDRVPRFREYVQKGTLIAKQYLNCDLLEIICNTESDQITQTHFAQPSLFIIEYAIARLLIDCGIKPDALIGHSIGEYVAACVAGVFSFEDGIALVCERGLLMANASRGEMLSLECTKDECLLYQNISNAEVALHNATNNYVFAGTADEINRLEEHLLKIKKSFQKLKVSHAFHSRLMEPLEKPFKDIFANIKLSPPSIPIISNVTGDWLSADEAINPNYWYKHLRHTVQLYKGITLLLHDKHPIFLEVGLGEALCGFVKDTADGKAYVTHTLPNHHQRCSDLFQFLNCMGELWIKGTKINLEPLCVFENKRRIALPTYPFQKQRYWVEPDSFNLSKTNGANLYTPVWTRQAINETINSDVNNHSWVIFKDNVGVGQEIITLLRDHEIQPIIVETGTSFIQKSASHFSIDPSNNLHYDQFIGAVQHTLVHPIIIHCFSCNEITTDLLSTEQINKSLDNSFYSLMYLTQSYINQIDSQVLMRCAIITTGTQNVLGKDNIAPVNATLIGVCNVIPLEHRQLAYQLIDIERNELPQKLKSCFADIINNCLDQEYKLAQSVIAYRNNYRWGITYAPIPNTQLLSRLTDNGTYLITGGLGGIGLTISETIATHAHQPTLILCSRSPCIHETEWLCILNNNSHPDYYKIAQLQKLKERGATIVWKQIDISDDKAVETLIENLKNKYEKINGIIHAAGVPGGGLTQLKSKTIAQEIFLPKIHGTYHLARATQALPPLDFVMLMSSIASITGEQGQLDYCSANACLDAFANANLFQSNFTISLSWNTWREIGMSVDTERSDEINLFDRGNDIASEEGQLLFLKALSYPYNHLIVSNYDLEQYKNLILQNVFHSNCDISVSRDDLNINHQYTEPQNTLEKQMARLWQDNLKINAIGRDDDFFTLGGHSLKALSLIEKINSTCKCSLSIQHLYKAPTIALLCKQINSNDKNNHIDIVVPMKQNTKNEIKIFFCHPASGMIYCFNPLVSQWQLPISIYGLQDPSISAGNLLFESISAIADSYASAIRKIQPNGPYFLAGYSFGGTVVYEIAHILKQKNQDIGLLALIEGWCVFSKQQLNKNHFITNFLSTEIKATNDLADLSWERMQLLLKHLPSQTKQDMVLFKAMQLTDDYRSIDDPLNGWAKYNQGNIICHHIQANHETIMSSENSQTIIDNLKQFLV